MIVDGRSGGPRQKIQAENFGNPRIEPENKVLPLAKKLIPWTYPSRQFAKALRRVLAMCNNEMLTPPPPLVFPGPMALWIHHTPRCTSNLHML